MSELCRRHGCEGLHLFALDPVAPAAHAHARCLSPLAYAEEEAARQRPEPDSFLLGCITLYNIINWRSGGEPACAEEEAARRPWMPCAAAAIYSWMQL